MMETTNLSKIKREKMLATINEIKKNISDENTLNNLSMIENELTKKKYGLIWEEHEERVDKELETKIPTFEEVKDKEIISNPNDKFNFLLEGDNLHSLYLLEKTYKERIDLIIIDPPYNTGINDFIYNDCYIDNDDGYKHSKWLSFMEKRLKIAHSLLSDNGYIFININDIEVAQLKLLCDDIFGEDNFVNIISVKMKNNAGASGGGEDKKLKKNIEYILVYSKNQIQSSNFNKVYSYTKIDDLLEYYRVNNISWKYTSLIKDFGEKKYCCSTYDGTGDEIKIYKRINPIITSTSKIIKDEGLSEYEVYKKYNDRIFTTAMPQSSIRPRVIEALKNNNFSIDKNSVYSIEYVPKTGKNKGTIYEQFYKGEKLRLFSWFKDVSENINGDIYKSDIKGTYWDGYNLNNLTKEGNVKFENGKKPLKLIQDIVEMSTNKQSIVLDFFAGSGTTAQAVLETNLKDNGNRKFILCTNNENNICETITYQRLKNIKNGYLNYNGINFNLKYYKCTYIPRINNETDNLHNNLLINIKNLIQLENGIEVDNNKVRIYLNEDELDIFSTNQEELDICDKVYISSDILLTSEQEHIFENNNIEVYIIPEYYFEDEIMEVM